MAGTRGAMSREGNKRQRAQPRAPSRERGVARFCALLDATETLLRDHSPDDIGMYQIAKEARVPAASAYHFFPNKEAAFVALVQRYIDRFLEITREPFRADRVHSWQDIMRIEQERARAYYNSYPAALKLIFGGHGGLESRRIDYEHMSSLADGMYARYNTVFHMPYIADPAKKFHIALAMMDSIWSLSYHKEGRITDDYANETLNACFAYCRLFLPDQVEVRQAIRDLAEQGGEMILPMS